MISGIDENSFSAGRGNYREVCSTSMNWQVYIILCSDSSLYTGITTDPARRLHQHATGRGAKYFRGRRPEKLLYLETGHTRSSAVRREVEIKRLTHAGKCLLAATERNVALLFSKIPGDC